MSLIFPPWQDWALRLPAAAWSPDDFGVDRLFDYIAEDVLLSGSNITAFVDQAPGGHNATQGNAAYQATIVNSHAPFNGHKAIHATSDYYDISGVSDASTSKSFCVIFDSDDITTLHQVLCDIQTGRLFVEHVSGSAGRAGFFDGTYKSSASWTLTLSPASEVWDFDGSGGQAVLYRGGSSLGSLAYSATVTGGAIRLFSIYSAPAFMVQDGFYGRITALNRATASGDRDNWFGWSNSRYGF